MTFISGTGGRFLSYLLNSSKSKDSPDIILSEHGNAHAVGMLGIEVYTLSYSTATPVDIQIQDILNFHNSMGESLKKESPHYCSGHIIGIDQLLTSFEKAVLLSYDEDDILDTSYAFIAKHAIDDAKLNLTEIKNLMYGIIKVNIEVMHDFISRKDLEPNLLNVSWKELYKGDINEFVKKISDFTQMPEGNFKVNDLIEWRKRTTNSIEKMRKLFENETPRLLIWEKKCKRKAKLMTRTK